MVVNQYEVFLIDLDPTRGHEIEQVKEILREMLVD